MLSSQSPSPGPWLASLSLRTKLLLMVVGVVLAGFAATVVSLTRQAGQLQEKTALMYAEELATRNAAQIGAELNATMTAARTLAQSLAGLKASGRADRAQADALLKSVLEGSPQFLGVWTAWEPDAFDGRDAEFAGKPGHDASGRYIPYWNRGSGVASVEVLVDYDKPGAGDYYQLPKRSGQETLIEPYKYTVAGKEVLITTTSVPIVMGGRLVGVAGIDVALSSLQDKVGAIRVYDTGYASLLSAGGLFVGDRDPANVGRELTAADEREPLNASLRDGRVVRVNHEDPRLEREARAIGQEQARLLSMASQFTRALQQADRQRVTLGSTGLTTSDVRTWLQAHPALYELMGEALAVPVRPVLVSQHDLIDVAEGEFERDRPNPNQATGLPPATQAAEGALDTLSLPAELGGLIDQLARWHTQAPQQERPLADAILGGRFAQAAYRMQLMPLVGDAQAQTLKGLTGDLARAPWRWAFEARHQTTTDEAVALISEGVISPRPVDDTPAP